jgi:hypothetical protein
MTCVHLEVGNSEAVGRFYARCALGTAADRALHTGPELERELQGMEAERDRLAP